MSSVKPTINKLNSLQTSTIFIAKSFKYKILYSNRSNHSNKSFHSNLSQKIFSIDDYNDRCILLKIPNSNFYNCFYHTFYSKLVHSIFCLSNHWLRKETAFKIVLSDIFFSHLILNRLILYCKYPSITILVYVDFQKFQKLKKTEKDLSFKNNYFSKNLTVC